MTRSMCPCCGQAVEAYPIDRLAAIITPVMGEIVEILAKRPGEFVSMEDIARHVWRRKPDGGPACATSSVWNALTYNRRRLQALGWDVVGRKGRNGGLMLVCLEAAA